MKLVYLVYFYFSLILLAPCNLFPQDPQPADTTISKNLEIFSSVYQKVLSVYPEYIDADKFMLSAINPMLNTIDPFTTFLTQNDVREFKTNMSGKFGGIGIVVASSTEGIIITEVLVGKPAHKAGLRAADLILAVDGIETKNLQLDEVLDLLRGTPGKKISITVLHAGDSEKTTFSFEREIINISPLPYYGMLNESIAYIRLTRESENCSEEVKSALKELYDTYNFKGLVFDLRGNEGGYFKEAVKIANLFIEKGELLVSTRGKNIDTSRFAVEDPLFPTTPLVLLIDNYTVSSGEILAGAIQDNDRAVLIGQQSFGKGLVQEVFDMPQGTQLKLTTSYYYTPSGRCIQAFEYSDGIIQQYGDSTKNVFKTKNGRDVYSNGGITPDIITPNSVTPAIIQSLSDDLMIFEFATQYKLSHSTIGAAKTFSLSDEKYSDFVEFVRHKNFNYQSETENKLHLLKEAAEKEGYWQSIQIGYSRMIKDLNDYKVNELLNNKEIIKQELEKEILYRYYNQDGRYEASLRYDVEIKKAVEILSDIKTYNKILSNNLK